MPTKKFVLLKRGGRVAGPYRPKELVRLLEQNPTHSAIALVPEKWMREKMGRPVNFHDPQERMERARVSAGKVLQLTLLAASVAALAVIVSVLRPSPERVAPTPVSAKTAAEEPDVVPALLAKAQVEVAADQFHSALADYELFHESFPNHKDLSYLVPYTILLMQRDGATPLARRLLDRLSAAPLNEATERQLRAARGYYWLAARNGTAALAELESVARERPEWKAVQYNLMSARILTGHPEQNFADLNRPNGDALPDLVILAAGLQALNKGPEMLAALRQRVTLEPERWLSRVQYIGALRHLGQPDEALAQVAMLLDSDPDYEWAAPGKFGYIRQTPDYEKYFSALEPLLREHPGDLAVLAQAYLRYLHEGARGIFQPPPVRFDDNVRRLGRQMVLRSVLSQPGAEDEEIRHALSRLQSHHLGYYGHLLGALANERLGDPRAAFREAELAISSQEAGLFAVVDFIKRMEPRFPELAKHGPTPEQVARQQRLRSEFGYSTDNSRFPLVPQR